MEGGENVTIKDLRDFVGNRYAVAECSPTGYNIYNYKNSSIVEYSEYADSPYLNCEGDLYYWSAVNPSLAQIRNQISYHGTPVIYENKFVNPNNTSQTVHHDVVVYGYTNDDRLVVHFGWPGRSHIVCTGTALLIWNSTASAIANYS